MTRTMPANVSLDGAPVRLRLESPHLLAMDMLALDGLKDRWKLLSRVMPPDEDLREQFGHLPGTMLYRRIDDFRPGLYEVDPHDLRSCEEGAPLDWFSVDSASVILVDHACVEALARRLTWEEYEAFCADHDLERFTRISTALGGPCYALIGPGGGGDFSGDGIYTLSSEAIRAVDEEMS